MKATSEAAPVTDASYSEQLLSISVIIPAHNASSFLRASLERLAKSTELPHEIPVVDDGSTDDSAEVARQFGAAVLSTGGRRGPAISVPTGPR